MASDRPWQVCAAGTAFVTLAVDVQAGRFVAQVEAWGLGLERTVIDRFDLHAPPEDAPGAGSRRIDPARHGEDWEVLTALADRAYPLQGASYALKPLSIVIDCGGEAGVTPNAYAFWRKRRASHPRRFHLVRGRGGDRRKRAEVSTPETAHRGKKFVARDVKIIWAAADRLKDEVSASLTRTDGGARSLIIPRDAPADIFAEYAAERRDAAGRWEKRPGVKRNEAFDLSVYALALAIVLGVEKINPEKPPAWAVVGPDNSFAVAREVVEAVPPPPEPKAEATSARPRQIKKSPLRRPRFNPSGW